MNTARAVALGNQIAAHIAHDDTLHALYELEATIATKTPFALLDRIGAQIGAGELDNTNAFLEELVCVNALDPLDHPPTKPFRGSCKCSLNIVNIAQKNRQCLQACGRVVLDQVQRASLYRLPQRVRILLLAR